jgi:hypothetical protein
VSTLHAQHQKQRVPELPLISECKRCQTAVLSRVGWLVLVAVVICCGLAGQPFYDGLMSGWVEFIASAILAVGVISGLIALHRHVSKFQEFELIHVLDGRIDAMIYVLLSFSTALCFFGLVVRTVWSWHVGWDGMSDTWKILVLTVDIGMGGISTGMHLLVSKVLSSGLWDHCKRL